MRYGTHVVTTNIVAEGICGDLPINGFITNDAQSFSDAAIELYNNSKVWNTAVKNGIDIIHQRFSSKNYRMEMTAKIQDNFRNLKMLRQKNITGAVLWHQSLNATKYMSKWIEEKNKFDCNFLK